MGSEDSDKLDASLCRLLRQLESDAGAGVAEAEGAHARLSSAGAALAAVLFPGGGVRAVQGLPEPATDWSVFRRQPGKGATPPEGAKKEETAATCSAGAAPWKGAASFPTPAATIDFLLSSRWRHEAGSRIPPSWTPSSPRAEDAGRRSRLRSFEQLSDCLAPRQTEMPASVAACRRLVAEAEAAARTSAAQAALWREQCTATSSRVASVVAAAQREARRIVARAAVQSRAAVDAARESAQRRAHEQLAFSREQLRREVAVARAAAKQEATQRVARLMRGGSADSASSAASAADSGGAEGSFFTLEEVMRIKAELRQEAAEEAAAASQLRKSLRESAARVQWLAAALRGALAGAGLAPPPRRALAMTEGRSGAPEAVGTPELPEAWRSVPVLEGGMARVDRPGAVVRRLASPLAAASTAAGADEPGDLAAAAAVFAAGLANPADGLSALPAPQRQAMRLVEACVAGAALQARARGGEALHEQLDAEEARAASAERRAAECEARATEALGLAAREEAARLRAEGRLAEAEGRAAAEAAAATQLRRQLELERGRAAAAEVLAAAAGTRPARAEPPASEPHGQRSESGEAGWPSVVPARMGSGEAGAAAAGDIAAPAERGPRPAPREAAGQPGHDTARLADAGPSGGASASLADRGRPSAAQSGDEAAASSRTQGPSGAAPAPVATERAAAQAMGTSARLPAELPTVTELTSPRDDAEGDATHQCLDRALGGSADRQAGEGSARAAAAAATEPQAPVAASAQPQPSDATGNGDRAGTAANPACCGDAQGPARPSGERQAARFRVQARASGTAESGEPGLADARPAGPSLAVDAQKVGSPMASPAPAGAAGGGGQSVPEKAAELLEDAQLRAERAEARALQLEAQLQQALLEQARLAAAAHSRSAGLPSAAAQGAADRPVAAAAPLPLLSPVASPAPGSRPTSWPSSPSVEAAPDRSLVHGRRPPAAESAVNDDAPVGRDRSQRAGVRGGERRGEAVTRGSGPEPARWSSTRAKPAAEETVALQPPAAAPQAHSQARWWSGEMLVSPDASALGARFFSSRLSAGNESPQPSGASAFGEDSGSEGGGDATPWLAGGTASRGGAQAL
ncbi:unnamed protein product, partial [Symbiodinium sp. KB8]